MNGFGSVMRETCPPFGTLLLSHKSMGRPLLLLLLVMANSIQVSADSIFRASTKGPVTGEATFLVERGAISEPTSIQALSFSIESTNPEILIVEKILTGGLQSTSLCPILIVTPEYIFALNMESSMGGELVEAYMLLKVKGQFSVSQQRSPGILPGLIAKFHGRLEVEFASGN